jgi:hypothetical protein
LTLTAEHFALETQSLERAVRMIKRVGVKARRMREVGLEHDVINTQRIDRRAKAFLLEPEVQKSGRAATPAYRLRIKILLEEIVGALQMRIEQMRIDIENFESVFHGICYQASAQAESKMSRLATSAGAFEFRAPLAALRQAAV